ncbi:MAG: polysaccharide biosynthesis C-terminal domain-containing protein [Halioglobus sp.]|nr:polysaccharide biosynthesis C-terminal domain-containing protein [Halioglobus sp.]
MNAQRQEPHASEGTPPVLAIPAQAAQDRVVRTVLWPLVLVLAAYAATYALNLFITAHTTPAFYGDFSVAVKVLAIVSSVTLLGTDVGSKRFMARYVQHNRPDEEVRYIHWNLRLVAIPFIVCAVVALLASIGMLFAHYAGFRELQSYHLAVYMLWVAPLAAILVLYSSFLLCHKHPTAAIVFQQIGTGVLMLAYMSVAALLLGRALDTPTIVFGFLLVTFVLVLLQWVFLAQRVPQLFHATKIALHRKLEGGADEMPEWARISRGLLVNNILFMLVGAIDLIIVEVVSPAEGNVGYYAALLTITGIIWFVPQGTLFNLKACVSSLISDQDGRHELQRKMHTAFLATAGVSAVFTALIIVSGRDLLAHFGTGYAAHYPSLVILVLGCFVGTLSRPGSVLLAYSDHQQTLVRVSVIELVALLILGVTLTFLYGVLGIATATSLALISRAVTVIILARRKTGLKAALVV